MGPGWHVDRRRATARLRPFVCVGLAYFLIGVIVPSLWLHFRGEKGEWTLRGIIWSLAGGALGAIGALGIILAFTFGGKPIYVMPLVFGGAPVVNAFLTIYLARRMKEIGPWFLAGSDHRHRRGGRAAHGAARIAARTPAAPAAAAATIRRQPPRRLHLQPLRPLRGSSCRQLLAIALAIVSWGCLRPGAAQRSGRDASQPACGR